MVLSAREKHLVAVGVAMVVLVVAAQLFLKPAAMRLETLRRVIPQKEADLAQLRACSAEYLALKSDIQNMRETVGRQEDDFRILSFLEQVQKECGLRRNVAYMKPSTVPAADGTYVETRVEVRVQGVNLQQITKFLSRIESDKAPVGVESLRIRSAAKTPTLLDATVHITSLAPSRP